MAGRRWPLPHIWLFPVALVGLYFVASSGVIGTLTVSLLVTWLLLYLPTLSLEIVWGYAGQLSVAYGGIFGVGAYMTAWNIQHGRDVYVSVLLGVVAATAAAWIVANLTMRLKGVQFVIATFAVGLLIVEIIKAIPSLGGVQGLILFSSHDGIPSGLLSDVNTFDYVVIGAIAVLLAFAVHNLARSPHGRRFVAVREDEQYAASIGVRIDPERLKSAVLAGVVAGLGGGLYVMHISAIDPSVFTVAGLAFNTVLALLLGGRGTFWGPIVGSAFVASFPVIVPWSGHITRALMGAIVIAVALVFPAGIVGTYETWRHDRRRARRAARVGRVAETLGGAEPRPVRAGTEIEPVAAADVHEITPGMLTARQVSKSFGMVRAVQETDLDVSLRPAETVGIAGPNGAGKSTLLSLLAGALGSDTGATSIDGVEIAPTEAARVAAGVVRVPQNSPTMPDQTVHQNIKTALVPPTRHRLLACLVRTPAVRRSERAMDAEATTLAESFGIAQYADYYTRELSYGNRRLCSLATAMATHPNVLLLDEPSAGLSPASITRIRDELHRVAAAGYSMVVVDHRLDFLDDLTQRIVMMDAGRIVAEGCLADHMADERIAGAYLGAISSTRSTDEPVVQGATSAAAGPANDLLLIEHVSIGYGGNEVLTDVTTRVPDRALVAWLGPNGAGKTTLGAAVAGIVAKQAGTFVLGDRVLDDQSPWARSWEGIAFVEADRKVFPRLTVRENLEAGFWAARRRRRGRSSSELREKLDLVYGIFPMLASMEDRAGGAMSGGQQQMLVTGRALMGGPRLAILDEPFAGLAPLVCDELGAALQRCVRELPMSIVMIDQDVARVCAIADRMLLLASGHVQLDGPTSELLARHDLLERFLGVAPDDDADVVRPG